MSGAEHAAERVQFGFDALSELYYRYWGEYFHLAIAEEGDDPKDLAACYERTHRRYFEAIEGQSSKRILEVACGGGAFAAWMAERTEGEVLGVDSSHTQLAHARRYASAERPNLRLRRWDAMELDRLDEPPFDAAVCLDAACYFPDHVAVLLGIAKLLKPGARLLFVDWCRAQQTTALQRELILDPLCRLWAIRELETITGYVEALAGAGFHVRSVDDLSAPTAFNWDRGYRLALEALAERPPLSQLVRPVAGLALRGVSPLRLAKEQFQVALLSKAAADAGVLRYVSFLAVRD
jgi:SAM-dependent methyltransferase